MAELIGLLFILCLILGGMIWAIIGVIAAGYYLSIQSLILLTLATYWIFYKRRVQIEAGFDLRAITLTATVGLGIVWLIAFFARWDGASTFFGFLSYLLFWA